MHPAAIVPPQRERLGDLRDRLERVIAEAIGAQVTTERENDEGLWWLSGGCTPQSAGCKLNLRDIADDVVSEVSDLDLMRSMLAEALGLPPDTRISTVTAYACTAIALQKAEDAFAEHRQLQFQEQRS